MLFDISNILELCLRKLMKLSCLHYGVYLIRNQIIITMISRCHLISSGFDFMKKKKFMSILYI